MEATLKLNAQQVITLFEMCEHCSSMIHSKHDKDAKVPHSFALVMSLQSKLDGCDNLESEEPTLLDQAELELRSKEYILPELLTNKSNALT